MFSIPSQMVHRPIPTGLAVDGTAPHREEPRAVILEIGYQQPVPDLGLPVSPASLAGVRQAAPWLFAAAGWVLAFMLLVAQLQVLSLHGAKLTGSLPTQLGRSSSQTCWMSERLLYWPRRGVIERPLHMSCVASKV